MTSTEEFTKLVEKAMNKKIFKQVYASKPSMQLIDQYGPLCDKITKKRSIESAIYLWNKYRKDPSFIESLNLITTRIDVLPVSVTTSTIISQSSLASLIQRFDSIMNSVLGTVNGDRDRLAPIIAATMDLQVANALSSVPKIGPVAGMMVQGITIALTRFLSSDQDIRDASVKGLPSLFLALADRNRKIKEEDIVAHAQVNSFGRLFQSSLQSINQEISSMPQDTRYIRIKSQECLRIVNEYVNYSIDEKQTINSFKNKTSRMYKMCTVLFEDIIGSGIEYAFSDATEKLFDLEKDNMLDVTRSQRIGLILMGYYYSKDWERVKLPKIERAMAIDSKNVELRKSILNNQAENPEETQKEIEENENISRALIYGHPYQKFWGHENIEKFPTAYKHYQVAKILSTKKGFSNDEKTAPPFSAIATRGLEYLSILKGTLVSDITSSMVDFAKNVDDKELIRMWKLYVGSNLIVNEAIRNSILGKNSRKGMEVNNEYVKMIEDAGFIHTHNKLTINNEEKIKMAEVGKMRWRKSAFGSPSASERAMLIAFCAAITFSLDIGRLSLGLADWKDTEASIHKLCRDISLLFADDQLALN
ncbi:hypothetical protein [Azorhizobium caulinodans]|nr:hypothetical protein [Azorhizobium caulinodans]